MPDWDQIAAEIARTCGEPFRPAAPQTLGGGCINAAVRLVDGARSAGTHQIVWDGVDEQGRAVPSAGTTLPAAE